MLNRLVALLLGIAAIAGICYWYRYNAVKQYESNRLNQQMKEDIRLAKSEADAQKALASGYDQKAAEAAKQIESLKAKLRSIKPEVIEVKPDLPQTVDNNLQAVVDVQAQIISTQDEQIKNLNKAISARDLQIGSLEKALKQSELRADIQEKAAKAALDGIKASKWVNRGEGFLAGAAIGYVTGRIH